MSGGQETLAEREMGRQNHVGIDCQVFIGDTVVETVRDDFAGDFVDENWEPLHNGEGNVIHTNIIEDAIKLTIAIRWMSD